MPGLFQPVLKTGVPQVQYSDKVVDVLAVAVHRRLDVPAIMQRRSRAVGGATVSVNLDVRTMGSPTL